MIFFGTPCKGARVSLLGASAPSSSSCGPRCALVMTALSSSKGEILKREEGKEEGKHHMMSNIYPSLFQKFDAQRRKEDLCKEGKEKSVHTHTHPALCLDVSLHGGIPPGRPPYGRKTKVFSQLWVAYDYLAKEGALGETSIV